MHFMSIIWELLLKTLLKNFKITREEQDKFALKSQEKALKAQKENKFKEEIVRF